MGLRGIFPFESDGKRPRPERGAQTSVFAKATARPRRSSKSVGGPSESERGWAASAKATASLAEAARRPGPASTERENMAQPGQEILRGTLDLLILKALSWGPAHGYGVARWIEQATADALAVGEGTLYPALHRLEERDWITASWGMSENNRQAKFYALTKQGRTQLRVEAESWRRYAAAVFAALDAQATR
jgi:PadR family transcriptional regulator